MGRAMSLEPLKSIVRQSCLPHFPHCPPKYPTTGGGYERQKPLEPRAYNVAVQARSKHEGISKFSREQVDGRIEAGAEQVWNGSCETRITPATATTTQQPNASHSPAPPPPFPSGHARQPSSSNPRPGRHSLKAVSGLLATTTAFSGLGPMGCQLVKGRRP